MENNITVLVTQLCLTLCDHMDCSPPGSSVHGILQVRILEWVAILFSRGTSQPGPGIKPQSPVLQTGSLPSDPPGKPMGNDMKFPQKIQKKEKTQQNYHIIQNSTSGISSEENQLEKICTPRIHCSIIY